MKLFHVNIVYKRDRNAKTHLVRNLLVLADSREDAKAKATERELAEKVDEVFARPTDSDQHVFHTGGISLTAAQLGDYRKLLEGVR